MASVSGVPYGSYLLTAASMPKGYKVQKSALEIDVSQPTLSLAVTNVLVAQNPTVTLRLTDSKDSTKLLGGGAFMLQSLSDPLLQYTIGLTKAGEPALGQIAIGLIR